MGERLRDKIFSKIDIDEKDDKQAISFITLQKQTDPKDKIICFSKASYQMDLVSMPDDDGFKYFLCIVNIYNRTIDAEPLRNKYSSDVLGSFHRIVRRNIINPKPNFILADQGPEFKNDAFKVFCEDNGINLIFSSVRRKNQMAIVEYYNGLIQRYLNAKMSIETIKTNHRNKTWVRYLKIVIEEINKFNKEIYPKYKLSDEIDKILPIQSVNDLIPLGAVVYPKLYKPIDTITGEPLYGKFRTGDVRYDYQHPMKIASYLFRPGRPIRYVLDGIADTSFTREELIVNY